MKYNFIVVSKVSKSNKHLPAEVANNSSFAKSKFDIGDLPNSNFPLILKRLSHKEWDKVNNGKKIIKTVITKETIIVEKKTE